jgi:hypothetical protein
LVPTKKLSFTKPLVYGTAAVVGAKETSEGK